MRKVVNASEKESLPSVEAAALLVRKVRPGRPAISEFPKRMVNTAGWLRNGEMAHIDSIPSERLDNGP